MSLSLPVTLSGRYRLTRRVGQGSHAQTFQATDEREHRQVAIKVLREHFSDDPHVTSRFERESAAARAVEHPNVIQVFDHGRDDESLFLVMEWIDGSDLKSAIRERGAHTVAEALHLMSGILAGLSAIHAAGIIHRDIKPQNILVDSSGMARIADFGVARNAVDTGMTETGTTIGTAAYMAPEQARGGQIGPQADLYAAGVVLFEMLTGQVPFAGESPIQVMYQHVHDPPPRPSSINPAIPQNVDSVVLKALAKSPVERFTSANDMLNALRSIEAETGVPASGSDAAQPTKSMTIVPPIDVTGIETTSAREQRDVVATSHAPEPFGTQQAGPDRHLSPWAVFRRVPHASAVVAIILLLATGLFASSAFRDGDADSQEPPVSGSQNMFVPMTTPTVMSALEPTPTETVEPTPTPESTPEPTPTPETPAPLPAVVEQPAPEPAENPSAESDEGDNGGAEVSNQDRGNNQGENGNNGDNENKPDKAEKEAEKEQHRVEKEQKKQEKADNKENKGQGRGNND